MWGEEAERPVWERADGCTAATAEGGWYSAACLPLQLTHQRAQGPAPSQHWSHDRKTKTTTTSEPKKITVRVGPGLPEFLPLSFSVLAVVWVQKCPIMWVKMHDYMSFSPSGDLEPSWCCGGLRPKIYTSRPLMELLLMTCTHTHTWRERGQVMIRAGAYGLHLNSRGLTSHVLDRCNYHPFQLGLGFTAFRDSVLHSHVFICTIIHQPSASSETSN